MKKEIFDQYLEAVIRLFGIDRSLILSNSKQRDVTEARQMLYYLCKERMISVSNIQKFMRDSGYDPQHPPIVNGIKSATKRFDADKDYQALISRIKNSIFI